MLLVHPDCRLIGRNDDGHAANCDLGTFDCGSSDECLDLSLPPSFAFQLQINTKKRQSLMLKVSIVDSGTERRLVLEGALIPASLMDLRIAWLRACAGKQGRRIVLVFKNH